MRTGEKTNFRKPKQNGIADCITSLSVGEVITEPMLPLDSGVQAGDRLTHRRARTNHSASGPATTAHPAAQGENPDDQMAEVPRHRRFGVR